jgi:hypothetical protein
VTYIIVKNRDYSLNGPYRWLIQEDAVAGDNIAAFDEREHAEEFLCLPNSPDIQRMHSKLVALRSRLLSEENRAVMNGRGIHSLNLAWIRWGVEDRLKHFPYGELLPGHNHRIWQILDSVV